MNGRLHLPGLALLGFIVLIFLPGGEAQAVEVERVVSPKGIEAWLVRNHANPIISLKLAFRGGAALDPKGKEGLARMVSTVLDEGAGDLNSQTFQKRLDDLSIPLHFSAGRDTFQGTLKTLTKNRDEAFDLLALALNKPRFDGEPISRMRSQLLAGLRQDAEDPDEIASLSLFKALFPDHPYGRPVKGTPETIRAITADDLRAFVSRRLARDNLLIGVVGDITPERLGMLLDKTFGGLPARASDWRLPEAAKPAGGKTLVVKKPVPQSAIVFAQEGLKRDDPDFYAAYVMNHVLGAGGFTSRLYTEIREKRGLAYSVGSYLYPLDAAGLIYGSAGTANKRVAETLKIIRSQWARMAKKGVTGEELKDAKTYLTGSFPLRFTSNGRVASILIGMQLDQLGIDYLDRRNGYIEAVTLEDVNRVAKKWLNPKKLTVVVVGEPEGVSSGK